MPSVETSNQRARRRVGLVFASVLGAVLILAVVMVAWIGVRGLLAYGHLTDAQQKATTAGASLSDPAAAAASIADISADTAAARHLTSDPVWRLGEQLPWA